MKDHGQARAAHGERSTGRREAAMPNLNDVLNREYGSRLWQSLPSRIA